MTVAVYQRYDGYVTVPKVGDVHVLSAMSAEDADKFTVTASSEKSTRDALDKIEAQFKLVLDELANAGVQA